MTYMQTGKNELKEYIRDSGAKAMETMEDTNRKRVMAVLLQRQSDAADILDCARASIQEAYEGGKKEKRFSPARFLVSPILTLILTLGVVVSTFLSVLTQRPAAAEAASTAAPNWLWLLVLLFALLILGQAVFHLVRKAKAQEKEKKGPEAETRLDLQRAKALEDKMIARLISDSEAICGMFGSQRLEGMNAYEDELVKLYTSLYEATVDRPDCEELSYSLTMAELMLRQLGLKTVPYSPERKGLFQIEIEDYPNQMRFPAIVREKSGEVVRTGEYIQNRALSA